MGKRKELSPVFFGISSLNSFLTNTSSPRMVMESASHFPSHLALINPDSKVIKSGIEYELAKYINDIRSDTNCIVKAMVKRYGTSEVPYTPSYIVFTEFEENGYIFLDYIEVEFYKSHHSFFGYLLEPTEKFTSLGYHSIIEEGDILAKTASLGEKGDYCYGLTGNVAFMTHPSVSEDGYVISESFAKRAKFHSITKRIINITNDMIPVNLYGNEEVFKFLPNIGENVREDGLLCALRKRNDYFSISDLNTRSINEVDMIFDTLTYVNPHSKVLDIKVVKGNYAHKSEKELSSKIFQQLDYYAEMYVNFFRNIISSFEEIMKEKKMLVGNSNVIRLTPRLHRLITDSYIRGHILPKGGTKSCYRKQNIEQYWIEVTTISELTPTYGYKMTDIHAAKGVICRVLPDECMPVDKNGVRADVIADPMATGSRMNFGRNYEAYLGAVSRDNRMRLINHFKSIYGEDYLSHLNEKDYLYIKDYLKGLYSLINPEMVEFLVGLTSEELIEHIHEVLLDNLYLYYPVDNEYNIIDVIDAIENSPYKPTYDTVTYIDEYGRKVETKEKIRIGQLYFMFLEKIGNSYSAVSSSFVNSFGFPIKATGNDKNRYPHSLTPTKTLGETEVRIFRSFMPAEALADMIDSTLNPVSHKYIIKHILESDKAFDTQFNFDRNVVPLGQTKSLMLFRHMINASGMDLAYEFQDPNNPIIEENK